ncbi:MAG: T9SS type A sorting domain-containing protein [Muribaculaceae bacterium]|nr:T9SS type A sorting domain-containing protein [Muribaculaceae bacterium]
MKKYSLILALTVGVAGVFASEATAAQVKPTSSEQSDCKRGIDSRSPWDDPEMSATVSYENGVLTLFVENFIVQCGAELVSYCKNDVPGELHFVVYDESDFQTDCFCPFDLTCTYNGILAGDYKIFFENKGGHVYLQAEAMINNGSIVSLKQANSLVGIYGDSAGSLAFTADADLVISVSGQVDVAIYDEAGCQCGQFTVEGPTEVSLASLPKGFYIISATANGLSHRLKIHR